MDWLRLTLAALGVVKQLLRIVEQKRLMTSGAVKQAKENLEATNAVLRHALADRDAVIPDDPDQLSNDPENEANSKPAKPE